MRRKTLSVLVVIAAAVTLAAQEKKEDAPKKAPTSSGDSAPGDDGRAPARMPNRWRRIGTKPAEPWTTTTTAAGVDSKPQTGRPITRVGEIVDFSCYIQLGKHGEKHRSCGQKCVQNGQPIGLLTQDGSLYMLMPEEHDPRRDGGVDAKASAADHMGHIVTVNGTEASVGGYRAIYVQGLTK